MYNLNVFTERLQMGKEGEDRFCELLKRHQIWHTRNDVQKGIVSPLNNLQNGDVIIHSREFGVGDIGIDVKYTNFVSKKSAEQFQGQYFALFDVSLTGDDDAYKFFLIRSHRIKKYMYIVENHNHLIKGPSGDPGWRFDIKNFNKKIVFADFIKTLKTLKRVVHPPNLNYMTIFN